MLRLLFGYKIDIITKNAKSGGFDLILLDNASSNSEKKRFQHIVKRCSQYADYICSGKFEKQYPDSKGCPVRICVISDADSSSQIKGIQSVQGKNDSNASIPVFVMNQEEYVEDNKNIK